MAKFRVGYFRKLFLFCFCIGVVPVVALGCFAYFKTSEQLLEKAESRNADMVEQTLLRIEQRLKTVDNTQTQFVNSPLVVKAMGQPLDAGNYLLYEELIQSLHRLQTYEFGLSDVFLINFGQDWILGSGGKNAYKESAYAPVFDSYSDMTRFSYWANEQMPMLNNVYHTVLVKKVLFSNLQLMGLVVALLPSEELSRMIPVTDEYGEMFVLDEHYRIIAAGNRSWIGTDQSGNVSLARLQSSPEEAGQYKVDANDDKPHVITYLKSGYNGWIYVSKVYISEVTRESQAIGWVTLAICSGLILLVCLLALQVSRSLYRPVDRLYGLALQSATPGGGSGKRDEFYWIESTLHGLLGNQRHMSGQLREYFTHKMLQGAVGTEEMSKRMSRQEMPDWRWMRVICLEIDTLEGSRYNEQDKDLLMFAINNIAGEIIPAASRLSPVLTGAMQVTVVGGGMLPEEENKRLTSELAHALQQAVETYLQLKTNLGVSYAVEEPLSLPEAYREAKEAMSYGIRLGRMSVIFLEDVYQELAVSPTAFPQHIASALLEQIRLLDAGQAVTLLNEFLVFVAGKPISHQELQLYLMRLQGEMLRLHQDSGGTMQELLTDDKRMLPELLALKTTEEIGHWFADEMIKPIVAAMERRRNKQAASISEQVLDIIHREIETPLTLEALGSRLNYHPEYIGRVFRKETGTAFGDYVARQRLQLAKRYLNETTMTVTSISEKLLYNKPQNFIRYFRKMEGITPGQYRDRHQGGSNETKGEGEEET
ncbi:helix-turn-helix domain-containing protein [Paenibacillus sp. PAMC21692]|uniref:helix-turn-helix domain-containing protein n=1 Tax=Paenibacillus sp. PAMC21692 TaxID=2762320 RepID=UPI00164E1516|nr:helix-turn-helix domain-containing protein [Paenibacillus sp. PAMC21692]QNK54432.1 helix-turn-helix domain-containing protein [Paenibacillus sp. PAMC21692]